MASVGVHAEVRVRRGLPGSLTIRDPVEAVLELEIRRPFGSKGANFEAAELRSKGDLSPCAGGRIRDHVLRGGYDLAERAGLQRADSRRPRYRTARLHGETGFAKQVRGRGCST